MSNTPRYHREFLDFGIGISIVLLLCTIVLYGFDFWQSLSFIPEWLAIKLLRFRASIAPWGELALKGASIYFAFFYVWASSIKKKPNQALSRLNLLLLAVLSLMGFFAGGYILKQYPVIYILATVTAYYIFLFAVSGFRAHMLMNEADRFNKAGQVFQNCQQKIDNEHSVNIPLDNGWINVVNPFAGTILTGNSGMGKTYGTVFEYVLQLMLKGFTQVIYDYKRDAGNITDFAFRCYTRYHKQITEVYHRRYGTGAPRFLVVDFDQPENSVQVNPVSNRLLHTMEDINNTSILLMENLNRQFTEKKGEFFLQSGEKLLNAALLLLRYTTVQLPNRPAVKGNCCSLPHLLSLFTKDPKVVMKLFASKEESKGAYQAFRESFEGHAEEQFVGQVASGKLPLLGLRTPNFYYVLSDEDELLDIGNPLDPKILCIRTHEVRYASYAPGVSVILGNLLIHSNTSGNLPLLYLIDELTTAYVNNLDVVISNARSKMLAVLLSFQDITQLHKGWGKVVGDVTNNVVGNIMTHAVRGETARYFEAIFGKVQQPKETIQFGRDDITRSLTYQLENVLPVSAIGQLSQGEIVGKIADTYQQPIDQKIFRGKIAVDQRARDFGKLSSITLPSGKEDVRTAIKTIAKDLFNLRLDSDKALQVSLKGFKAKGDFRQAENMINLLYNSCLAEARETVLWDTIRRVDKEVDMLITQELQRLSLSITS